jgi:hypothetical protein
VVRIEIVEHEEQVGQGGPTNSEGKLAMLRIRRRPIRGKERPARPVGRQLLGDFDPG